MAAEERSHPLVKATEAALKQSFTSRYGLRKSEVDGTMAVRVSEQMIPRALRVLHAVITAAEARGWTTKPLEQHRAWPNQQAGIVVGKEVVGFVVAEGSKLLTLQERRKRFGSERHHYRANGRLRLELLSFRATRNRWALRNENRNPELIEAFLDAVGEVAEEEKISRTAQRAKQQKEKEEEELAAIQAERKEELDQQLIAWRWARALREMIEEVRRKLQTDPDDMWRSSAIAKWIELAEESAAQADPLENGYFSQWLATLESDEGD